MCVRKISHRKMPFRTITCRDYSKYNHTVLARDIENYDWNPVYTETNVNIAHDYMEQGLTTIIYRHASKIAKRVKYVPYSPQTKRCLLCLNEKFEIAAYKEQNLLNKRNEIVSKCRHQLKYALARFDTND